MEPANPQSPNLTPGIASNPVTPTPTTPPVPPSPFVSEPQTPVVMAPVPENPNKGPSVLTLAIVLMIGVLIIALGYIAYTKFSVAPATENYTQETLDTIQPTYEPLPEEVPLEENVPLESTDSGSPEVTITPTPEAGVIISE